MEVFHSERIIALDLRRKSLGYVVFEGETRLLDWGVHRFSGGVSVARTLPGPKIRDLLAMYVPDALVVKRPRSESDEVLSDLKQAAAARNLSIHFLSPREVKSIFPNCRNKEQIASAVSERLPDVLWILPPRRKIWNSEHYRMKIFDAAATGLAYFSRKRQSFPPI